MLEVLKVVQERSILGSPGQKNKHLLLFAEDGDRVPVNEVVRGIVRLGKSTNSHSIPFYNFEAFPFQPA